MNYKYNNSHINKRFQAQILVYIPYLKHGLIYYVNRYFKDWLLDIIIQFIFRYKYLVNILCNY